MPVPATRGSIVRFGVFEADFDQRVLNKSGQRVRLQDQPFQILRLLVERPGELVTRDEIRQQLWTPDTYVEFDDGLNTAIKKLRTALGDSADNPRFIETVPRRGYRFIAPVSYPAPPPTGEVPEVQPFVGPPEPPHVPPPGVSPRTLVLAVFFLIAVVSGGLFYRARHNAHAGEAKPSLGVSVRMRPSVAVLGFQNSTGRPDQAWLSTALSQMLSTELAEGEQLRMVSSEQIARAGRDNAWQPGETLAKDSLARLRLSLNTDYVTLGSYTVVGSGDQAVIRLDVRLQDAIAGETVAETSVSGNEAQLFDIVSQAGTQMRQHLGIDRATVEHDAQAKATLPKNVAAERFYADGIAKLRVYDAPAARTLFQKAIVADPQHALSHAGLAEAWRALGYDANATTEAKSAFDLSANLSREDRLSIEGRYREITHDYPRAVEIYKALNSFFPDNLEYALQLTRAQVKVAPKDALQTIAAMRALPPLEAHDPRIDLAESVVAENLSDFKRSEQAAESAEAKADTMGSRQLKADAKSREAWAWSRLGETDKAIASYNSAFELDKAAGNPREAAVAMHGIAHVQYTKGDLLASRQSYELALAEFRKIGSLWDVASCEHNLSIPLTDQGHLQLAKTHLEEALRIQRELNDPRGVASDLDDLSNVLLDLGQLDAAVKMKQEALEGFEHIGNPTGQAITLSNFGVLLLAKGDPAAAKEKLDQSLAIKQKIGFKGGIAFTQFALATVLLAQDHLVEARSNAEQSQAARIELKDENQLANNHVLLAMILLEEGRPVDAEPLAASAAETFNKQQDATDASIANSVLTRALFAQGKMREAQLAADRALALSRQSEDLTVRFQARLAAAQAQIMSAKSGEALKSFESIRQDAHRYGYVPYELEARLHQAEIQFHAGNKPAAHAISSELEKDARSHGFALLARKAADLASHTS